MKILLVGEYSRLHNSLKEGLTALGHEVIIIGKQDGFKQFPVDILIKSSLTDNKILSYLASGIHKLFRINFFAIEDALRWYIKIRTLKGFDIVQLYNQSIAKTYPRLEKKLVKVLKKNNRKLFLLSCGIDYPSVKYAQDKKLKYSVMTPLHSDPSLKDYYKFILKQINPSSVELFKFIENNVHGIIASDIDYHLPLIGNSKYLGLIPNPINTELISYLPNPSINKIIIFHGINKDSYIKKGNTFFTNALNKISDKYEERVEIIITENLPYKDYIRHYKSCHILLDQVYAYDQGYNALEAMAMGKVVFTGAENEWLEYYNLKEDTVVINALPDEEQIFNKLEWLINNPNKILEISKSARAFIEKEHNYILSAKKYLKAWSDEEVI